MKKNKQFAFENTGNRNYFMEKICTMKGIRWIFKKSVVQMKDPHLYCIADLKNNEDLIFSCKKLLRRFNIPDVYIKLLISNNILEA